MYPLEVAIQLANTLSADAWLNIPTGADDTYVTGMAELVNCAIVAESESLCRVFQ